VNKKLRVLIDTDVFLIDLRYTRDSKYSENRYFLEQVKKGKLVGWTTVYNLMEVCGILSFNLNPHSLQELFIGFAAQFNVRVLFPKAKEKDGRVFFIPAEILEVMKHKLSFADALIADIAQKYSRRLDFFVTWNAVHFKKKLSFKVLTPDELPPSPFFTERIN